MPAGRDAVRAVADHLPPAVPLIIDPVICSSGGRRLLSGAGVRELVQDLFPRALLVTPNLREAEVLSGLPSVSIREEKLTAGERILDPGTRSVLIKGGHAGECGAVDLLISRGGAREFRRARYPYDPHGTGCCLSAAITAFIAKGYTIDEAVGRAKLFTHATIRTATASRSGRMVHPHVILPEKDPTGNQGLQC
jgi:hydroxymethylpyrimidine/phosphomethylpyrimidine kinase